jgi:hypothetical protein
MPFLRQGHMIVSISIICMMGISFIIINQKVDRVNLLFLKRLYREKKPGIRSQGYESGTRGKKAVFPNTGC